MLMPAMKNYVKLILFSFLICLSVNVITAQESENTLLFIYDASGSMWGQIESKTKKEIASKILIETVDKLDESQRIGFMAYGHRSKGDCSDIELLVELENRNRNEVKEVVKNLNPLGKTPLATSVQLAIDKIIASNSKTTIILITDGIESCDGDLCKVVQRAKQEGIDFKLHIVGFGLKNEDLKNLKCAAKSGEGLYFDAENGDQLTQALDNAVTQKIGDPVPNHSFYTSKNGKGVDAWIRLTDKNSGEIIKGIRTYQDTAHMFIPQGEYTIIVNPLEGTDIASKSLHLTKSPEGPDFNAISFDGGTISIFITDNGEGWDATVKVVDPQTEKVVASSRTYGRKIEIEVNEGVYNLVVTPLQIKGLALKQTLENCRVFAKETIEKTHDFHSGTLSIGIQTESGDYVDGVVKVLEIDSGTYVTGLRTYSSESNNPKTIKILPGNYKINIQTLGKHKGVSQTANIDVFTGKKSSKTFKIQ